MKIEVREVNTKRAFHRFITYPFKLYADNAYWVPPLIRMEKQFLSPRNPVFKQIEFRSILAFYKGRLVGRAAVFINQRENDSAGVAHARFGWLDFENNIAITKALFRYMEDWALSRGMTALKGPMGFTNFDKAGMLYEGFDKPGTMATLYNHPYYPKHLDSLGYQKLADWHEFVAPVPEKTPEKVSRLAKLLYERYGLQDIPVRGRKDVNRLMDQFFPLVEAAYADIEGFVPFSDAQKLFYKKRFAPFLHPQLTKFIADQEGRLIAFGISMPSFTKALQKARGRLFPFGWYYIRQALKHNDLADLYLIGVHPKWQRKGIPAIIINDILDGMRRKGIRHVESNPELETNKKLHLLFGKYETHVIKKRRVFIKELIDIR